MKDYLKIDNGNGFPDPAWFVFTGEPSNPWRCQNCATQKHTGTNAPAQGVTFGPRLPVPTICRKCGRWFKWPSELPL
jgi:hypothetical protein